MRRRFCSTCPACNLLRLLSSGLRRLPKTLAPARPLTSPQDLGGRCRVGVFFAQVPQEMIITRVCFVAALFLATDWTGHRLVVSCTMFLQVFWMSKCTLAACHFAWMPFAFVGVGLAMFSEIGQPLDMHHALLWLTSVRPSCTVPSRKSDMRKESFGWCWPRKDALHDQAGRQDTWYGRET